MVVVLTAGYPCRRGDRRVVRQISALAFVYLLFTRTEAVAVLPSLLAVMIADPFLTPRTRPVLSTTAILVSLLAHSTVARGRVLPRES